jgi:hypothetical protein
MRRCSSVLRAADDTSRTVIVSRMSYSQSHNVRARVLVVEKSPASNGTAAVLATSVVEAGLRRDRWLRLMSFMHPARALWTRARPAQK